MPVDFAPRKRAIRSPKAPSPQGAYSPAVQVGELLFISGQIPLDPATGELAGSSIEAQTEQVLRNVQALLGTAGMSLGHIVKVTAHLESFDLFDGFDDTYRKFVEEPLPARTTVASELGGFLIELDAIAMGSAW